MILICQVLIITGLSAKLNAIGMSTIYLLFTSYFVGCADRSQSVSIGDEFIFVIKRNYTGDGSDRVIDVLIRESDGSRFR